MTEQNEQPHGPWAEDEAAAPPSSAHGGDADDVEGHIDARPGGIGRIPVLGRVVIGAPGVTDYVEGVFHNPYNAEHGPG